MCVSIRRERLRFTIKWGAWRQINFDALACSIHVGDGLVGCSWDCNARVTHWYGVLPLSGQFHWWFGGGTLDVSTGPAMRFVVVPTWFLILILGVPTMIVWWNDRKPLPGTCPNCGYDRTGLPAGRACPECGNPH